MSPESPDDHGSAISPRARLIAVVVVVVLLVVGGVVWLTTRGGDDTSSTSASSPSSSAGASPSSTAKPSNPAKPGKKKKTVAPYTGKANGQHPKNVAFRATGRPGKGLVVSIAKVESITSKAVTIGEVGGPALRITVAVHNQGPSTVPISSALTNLYYGPQRTPADPAHEPGSKPFPPSVGAGPHGHGDRHLHDPQGRPQQARPRGQPRQPAPDPGVQRRLPAGLLRRPQRPRRVRTAAR